MSEAERVHKNSQGGREPTISGITLFATFISVGSIINFDFWLSAQLFYYCMIT
jgi:hypothetical protein